MVDLENGIKNFVERAVIVPNREEALKEYFLSKREDRNIRKYPEWDKPHVHPETELIRSRLELEKISEALRAKWAERDAKRKHMDEQWKEMREQELLLRESFIKFNKFIKENQEKRERAERKIKEEKKRQTTRQEEIDDLTRKLEYMIGVREKMQKHVQQYKKYQNYLERVVSETTEFQSINEIFNRYETLVETKLDLAEEQDKSLEALENTETEIYHMSEARSQMLMGLNNKLAQLQPRYDKAKALALKWETTLSRIKATAAAKSTETIQVQTCCWNLYQHICKKKGIPVTLSPDDFEQQLNYIKRSIQELRRIIKIAKRHITKK